MVMGVFSDRGLKRLIETGVIKSRELTRGIPSEESKIGEDQIQPGSLDLRIGGGISGYCLHSSCLPPEGNLEDFFMERSKDSCGLSFPSIYLHKGAVYVFPLVEELNLPSHLVARANPKSTTGRLDVHTRLITEKGYTFDNIPAGYKGKLWLEVYPRSFDLVLSEGVQLSQLRVMDRNISPLTHEELICLHREQGILYKDGKKFGTKRFEKHLLDNVVLVTPDMRCNPVGYSARKVADAVDFRHTNPRNWFFSVINLNRFGGVTLEEGGFGIFGSNERINIPLEVCAEMVDIDTGVGEFRSHYAGFFDPGFNATAVLEMRNLGAPFSFFEGQKIAGFKFFHMKDVPEQVYGQEGLGSSYSRQRGPKLAKYFIED